MSRLYKTTTKEKLNKTIQNRLPSFAEYYFRTNPKNMTESSLYAYSLDLTMFFEYIQLAKNIPVKNITIKDFEKITEEELENYMEYSKTYVVKGITKQRSEAALKRRFDILSAFYFFYYSQGMIRTLPNLRINRPKKRLQYHSYSSDDENLALLDYIMQGELNTERSKALQYAFRERDAAIVALMCYAGLKCSECVNLSLSDLHLEEKYIVIKRRRFPKVNLSDFVINLISSYLIVRLDKIPFYGSDDALFLSIQGTRLSERSIQLMIKKYTTALFGLDKKITAQSLATSFKNNVYNGTHSINITAALTGCQPCTLEKDYAADIDEILSTAVLSPDNM